MRGILVTATVALLVGCDAGRVTHITATPTTTASDALQDRVFFAELADDPSFLTADRDQLVRVAHQVCDRFGDDGKTVTIERLMDSGISLNRSLTLAVAAAKAYCPEHLAELR